jgi:hypothetical protein
VRDFLSRLEIDHRPARSNLTRRLYQGSRGPLRNSRGARATRFTLTHSSPQHLHLSWWTRALASDTPHLTPPHHASLPPSRCLLQRSIAPFIPDDPYVAIPSEALYSYNMFFLFFFLFLSFTFRSKGAATR